LSKRLLGIQSQNKFNHLESNYICNTLDSVNWSAKITLMKIHGS